MDPNQLPKNSTPAASQTAVKSNTPRIPKPAVVEGAKIVPPKETFGKKLRKTFINDNLDIKGYIINNILVPTLQGTVFSIISNAVSMIFKRPNSYGGTGFYNQPYNPGWPPVSSNPWATMAQPNQSINYGQFARPFQSALPGQNVAPMAKPTDIQIPTQDMAEKALAQMRDILQGYGRLTMLDFFETLGVKGNGYTDQSWGWVDLMGVSIKPHYAGGYYIDMPRAVALV